MQPRRNAFRAAALLAGLAAPASPASAAPNADPSLHTDLSTLCSWNFSCGGTAARLKWSRTGPSCWSNVDAEMPFAVILRGNGYPHTSYDYLQDHLAQNGIVSAALDVIAEPRTEARLVDLMSLAGSPSVGRRRQRHGKAKLSRIALASAEVASAVGRRHPPARRSGGIRGPSWNRLR